MFEEFVQETRLTKLHDFGILKCGMGWRRVGRLMLVRNVPNPFSSCQLNHP
jgi:hypothetical protein